MSPPLGVYDLESATRLARNIVLRLWPDYRGPWDCQALLQFMEAELTRLKHEKA